MAGIVTYDTVVVQQGQCLMDVALQHYGTTDPQALIALVQDNGLDSVTAQIKAGDVLKIRNNAAWDNKKVVGYYRNNKITPSSQILDTTNVDNLIEDIIDYSGDGYIWNNPNLSFVSTYGFKAFGLILSESITPPFGVNIQIESNLPVSFYLEYGEYNNQYNYLTQISIPLASPLANINQIYIAFNYINININYTIKLIVTKVTIQAA